MRVGSTLLTARRAAAFMMAKAARHYLVSVDEMDHVSEPQRANMRRAFNDLALEFRKRAGSDLGSRR
jgi:hypothetical protein